MPSSDALPWPSSLPLPLVGPSRELVPRNEVYTMESKWLRVRPAFDEHLVIVNFEWNFTVDEYDAFRTFFLDSLLNGQYPFYITLLNRDDSNENIVTEYGFLEPNYQFARSDNQVNVLAVMLIEEAAIEQIEEPFDPALCGVIIWPAVSDGEGGGNTFECYTVGSEWDGLQMPNAGTGLLILYNGFALGYVYGEDFETFEIGDLVLGSPSGGSELTLMYYGDSPLGYEAGETWDGYADTASGFTDGTSTAGTGLGAYYVGDFIP